MLGSVSNKGRLIGGDFSRANHLDGENNYALLSLIPRLCLRVFLFPQALTNIKSIETHFRFI